MAKEKICLHCGAQFTPKNAKALFCKTSHRVAFYKRKKRQQNKEAAKIAYQKLREKFFASAPERRQQDIEWLKRQNEKEFTKVTEGRQNW
ncbi:MAG TPA: hypothetical protein VK536_05840 [Candidatus Limnocylindrales bacterium]|nr:hypothetical protein [Candidatus Limnocylindrales bacterium]